MQAPAAHSLEEALRILGTRKTDMVSEVQRLQTECDRLLQQLQRYEVYGRGTALRALSMTDGVDLVDRCAIDFSFDEELKRVPIGKPAPAATFNLDGAKVRPACTYLGPEGAHTDDGNEALYLFVLVPGTRGQPEECGRALMCGPMITTAVHYPSMCEACT